MANFDGRPGVLPITAYYKGTFGMVFSFTSGGAAYSLVGASATFVIYEKNGTAALSLSSGSGLTISGAGGTITLAITNAQMVALSTQEYNYELILTLAGGSVWPVLDSVFNVSEDGQASYSGSAVTVALDGNTISMTILPAAGDVGTGGGIADGDTLTTGLTFPNTGLHILDTNATHDLIIAPGSNLTADHTLTITTGDADRTLTISGDTTLSGGTHSGTNTGDQTSVTGNAGTVTVADAGGDTTTWVLLGTAQAGNLSPATDAGLTYNATTNALTATTFIGALTGNADTVTGFSGTHSGTSSGTNTGDQNLFSTIAVSGQSNVVADSTGDTLTLVAGTNVTITTDASTDSITINASGGGGGGTWGSITGTLSSQTDLQTALDGKVDENAGITGATKTKITYDAKGLVTAGADATTADIADSSNRRYVTDAQQTVIGNTSGTNTGDQTSVTGNAGTVTVADAAADTTTWPLLGRSQTGNLSPAKDAGLTYNATTNALTATTFVGALTGNADTVTGFSGTHSGTSSGTNTGDVTLAGTPDYITISGQTITRGAIDLTTDVTGALPIANGGTALTALGTASQQLRVNAGATALEYFTPSGGGGAVSTDTIWDAKGDLAVGTGADTAAKLTVGANGKQLYADSGESTGLRWGPDVISPSQITADQDDYTPTGWADAQIVRLDGDNGIRAITSMAAGYSGEIKQLVNVGSYPIYFPGEHPDGTAANRVNTPCDYILFPKRAIQIYYDGTLLRWAILGQAYDIKDGRGVRYDINPGSTTGGDFGDRTITAINSGSISASAAVSGLPPFYQLNTLTNTAGGYIVAVGKSATDLAYLSSAHVFAEALISIPTLSDGTETFQIGLQIVGVSSSSSAEPSNTIGIRYSHGVNSGKLEGYNEDSGGSQSSGVDLGVTVAPDTLYKIRIEVDKGKTESRFYVDGVFCGRATSNLPASASVGARAIINKSAGSTTRVLRLHNLNAGAIYS